ncbi:MAG: ribosome biogenesis GTP-binding protein YihA/YsxC [Acholeplasma sp.]|nr:ribosome biogenesis GTP-binding protein YihA/YsxC [Acholeplasma sp.]
MKDAEYIKGVTNIEQLPDNRPAFLLLGRSNVGKSSFINALTNRKNLARTSGTPGKTIVLNHYLINKNFYLVDAPGYGYAKRSKSIQQEFLKMINNILMHHKDIISVILLIDFKVGPTNDDLSIYDYLLKNKLNVIVVATKMDKVPKTHRYKQEKTILQLLKNPHDFYTVSNTNKDNIEIIKSTLLKGVDEYESC